MFMKPSLDFRLSKVQITTIATKMCKLYPELCKELTLCLEMMPQDLSPSIAAAKRNALKIIQDK